MKPLTDSVPKALLPAAGMTLVERLISSYHAAGVTSITVGVGWKGDMIREHLENLSCTDRIQTVDVPDYSRGPLQTLVTALSEVEDETYLVSAVDYVVEPESISRTMMDHLHGSSSRAMTLLLGPWKQSGTPVFAQENGQVAGIGEQVLPSRRIGCSAMLLVVNRPFGEICRGALSRGTTSVPPVVNSMISDGMSIRSVVTEQEWFDVDDISSLLSANHHLLQQMTASSRSQLLVPHGSRLTAGRRARHKQTIVLEAGAELVGPVLISQRCRVGNGATVGPFVTMDSGSQVGERCSVERSVLSAKASLVHNTQIKDSVVFGTGIYGAGSNHVTE